MARPLPGTELYRICEEGGFLTDPIVPEIGRGLKGEIFERRMIATPEFVPADIEARMTRFNRRIIAAILRKTLFFLLRHPTVMGRLLRAAWHHRQEGAKTVAKRLFFSGLFYKFNYLRRR
jgi:hypothetical protein